LGNVLIFCPRPDDREYLYEICRPAGLVYTAATPDKAATLLQDNRFDLGLVDAEALEAESVRSRLHLLPVLFLTGRSEERLKEAVRRFPAEQYVDYLVVSGHPIDQSRGQRLVRTAIDYLRLKSEVENLNGAKTSAEDSLKRLYEEVKGLGAALSQGLLREIEKRTALEARYTRFQSLKQRFEDILRILYAANDVSNLLDVVIDIKELLGAGGVSLYIIEENDALGRYLKPLVWDDAFLAQADFSRHVASLGSSDFAAVVARTGEEINAGDAGRDPRCSARYREQLRRPPESLLAAPLCNGREIVGVLEVYDKLDGGRPGGRFSAEDQQILRGLCEHISLAMNKLNLIQYDALTGLLRPEPFLEKVVRKIETLSKRRQETGSYAMVMSDVDWFKNYNDRLGHEAGNRLLRDLSGVLRTSIRDNDLLCRYGGEEFLFFLTGVKNIEEATLLTERIRKAVEDHVFEHEEIQPRHNLTMSFGVTLLPQERTTAPGGLTKAGLKKHVNEADLALAEAKGKRLSALQVDSRMIAKNKVCAYIRENSTVVSKTTILRVANEKLFMEKRMYERYYTSTLCIFRENGGHRVATTVDLSLGGAKITSETAFPLAKALDLFLVLGGQANPMRGEVVYCQKAAPQSPFYYTGLKFRDVSPADKKLLESYFLSLGRKEAPPA
jgi:diguanylate cyclase (GGDEF)-like protein